VVTNISDYPKEPVRLKLDYMSGLPIPSDEEHLRLPSTLEHSVVISINRQKQIEDYLRRKIDLSVLRNDLYYIDFLEAEISARAKRSRYIALNPQTKLLNFAETSCFYGLSVAEQEKIKSYVLSPACSQQRLNQAQAMWAMSRR